MRFEIVTLAFLALLVGGCDHECSCVATGTWAGKTTVDTGGSSTITSHCASDTDVTSPGVRKNLCENLCIARAKQGGASDYESIAEPQSGLCEKDCQATAKIANACTEGKRVSTFGAWN